MEVFKAEPRGKYLETQISRSRSKFDHCKVSIGDAVKYRRLLGPHSGPTICMGTRSGREIDLLRIAFFGSAVQQSLTTILEKADSTGWRSRAPAVESFGRSDLNHIHDRSTVGVEINPDAARKDTLIASFDDLPASFDERFGLIFTNSFDHSHDPERTASAWKRILKPGGHAIICWADDFEPTVTDPVGNITADEIKLLFHGTLIYESEHGSRNNYNEAIVRIA